MSDYKSMYLSLFNSITDAINVLTDAQKKTEIMCIESDDKPAISLLTRLQDISEGEKCKEQTEKSPDSDMP